MAWTSIHKSQDKSVKIIFQSGQDVKKGELLIQLDDSLDQQTLKTQQANYI